MSGPRPQAISVTEPQRQVLEQIIRRGTSPQRLVGRARLILAAAAGATNAQAARQAGVSRETARAWRGRWRAADEALLAAAAEGGDGDDRALAAVVRGVLADEPRPGAPATFTPEQFCQLMALACTPPEAAGRPIDRWTPRELADEAVARGLVGSISARTVGRFLVLGGGRPAAPPEPLLADAGPR